MHFWKGEVIMFRENWEEAFPEQEQTTQSTPKTSEDLDVLGLLRKYENTDKLKKQAADEIEHLRKAGDALAEGVRTGRWDDALDAWTELRGE